jgi:hypothetical protein
MRAVELYFHDHGRDPGDHGSSQIVIVLQQCYQKQPVFCADA